MLINTNNTSQAPESKTETIQLSPLEKTLLVNGRMDVALAAVKRMFVVTPDDETLEWIADRLYRQPYTSDVVMSVLPTIAIILHLTPHWTAKRLFEVGPMATMRAILCEALEEEPTGLQYLGIPKEKLDPDEIWARTSNNRWEIAKETEAMVEEVFRTKVDLSGSLIPPDREA